MWELGTRLMKPHPTLVHFHVQGVAPATASFRPPEPACKRWPINLPLIPRQVPLQEATLQLKAAIRQLKLATLQRSQAARNRHTHLSNRYQKLCQHSTPLKSFNSLAGIHYWSEVMCWGVLFTIKVDLLQKPSKLLCVLKNFNENCGSNLAICCRW